jgi:hypothetical protein
MRVHVFSQIKSKPYYSPDYYCNLSVPFIIRPRERMLLILQNSSKHHRQSEQFKIKFSKGHFYYKFPSYKFSIFVKNMSRCRKLYCPVRITVSSLLEHPYIHHHYSHLTQKDIKQARLNQAF